MLVRILKIVAICILVLTQFTCKKLNAPKGYLSLFFNNTHVQLPLVEFEKEIDNKSTVYLHFDNTQESFFKSESIYLSKLEKTLGKIKLNTSKRIFSWCVVEQGDLVEGCMRLDTSALDSSWIEITEMNKRFTNIKGKMQAVLKVNTGNRWGPPGTRIFVTGEFSARK